MEDVELSTLFAAVAEGRVDAFEDQIEVAPGVEVIRIGGHTPGQSVVRVPTSAGVVLLASDAIHYYEEYERDMPFSSVAELVQMYEGFDRIRAMIEAGEVDHLVSGHDPDTLDRFRPLGRSDADLVVTVGAAQAGAASPAPTSAPASVATA